MIVKQIKTSGQLKTNTYVVHSEQTLQGIVIDPGMDCGSVIEYIDLTGIRIDYVVNTHAHHDHCAGNAEICRRYNSKLAYHKKDDILMQIFIQGNVIAGAPCPVVFVSEGDSLSAGDMAFAVLETPGHTEGSISLCCNQGVFIGDLDVNKSLKILSEKIMTILEHTHQCQFGDSPKVYPGHGNVIDLSKIMQTLQTPGR